MRRSIRGSLLSLVLLGASALVHAEPTVSDVKAVIQAGQFSQAEQMIKEVAVNHPNAPRVHYMLALALSHQPGREAEARQELQQARNINPQLPFADATEVAALEDRVNPQPKVSAALPASPNHPFVPHLQRPQGSLYDRAMDFIQRNNIAVAGGVGAVAIGLIVLSFLGKKKSGDGSTKKTKKLRRREPELPEAGEAGQEAETFDYGRQPGERGEAAAGHRETAGWESPLQEEHEDFAR